MINDLITPLLTQVQKERLTTAKEIDLGYAYNNNRFRINIYNSRGQTGAAFRLISTKIRTLAELFLPQHLAEFTHLRQGFVLFTGPTGEGKSTSLASIINEINLTQSQHILTIEDPIEYVYPSALSIVSQREIGQDTSDWNIALKSALREDPDVILVGEMRDYEAIQAALTLAETGHLVFSTLHTNSVPQTIDRIVDVFPSAQQNQIRLQLAATLRAIISQRLVPSIDKKTRYPACEILINNPAVASIIRENKTHLIENVLDTSAAEGMTTMEKSLLALYREGKISREAAQQYAIRLRQIKRMIM
jgi:twitching motility protein PilT